MTRLEDVSDVDCVIVAVAHREFRQMPLKRIMAMYRHSADDEKVQIDVKGLYAVKDLATSGMKWWRL